MQICTAREVATLLKLREATVCVLASQGKLPGCKVGKSWRFDLGRIEALFVGNPMGSGREGDRNNNRKEVQ